MGYAGNAYNMLCCCMKNFMNTVTYMCYGHIYGLVTEGQSSHWTKLIISLKLTSFFWEATQYSAQGKGVAPSLMPTNSHNTMECKNYVRRTEKAEPANQL